MRSWIGGLIVVILLGASGAAAQPRVLVLGGGAPIDGTGCVRQSAVDADVESLHSARAGVGKRGGAGDQKSRTRIHSCRREGNVDTVSRTAPRRIRQCGRVSP